MKQFFRYFFAIATTSLLLIACSNDKTKAAEEANTPVKDDGLAKTPPMGWNSWNVFGKNLNEENVKETADAIVASGLKEVGFEYIVLDDFWHGGRDSVTGLLYADKKKFPSGIKALADYVHSKGLKFGIYSDAGTKTCGEMPGSYGYEEKDAKLFAEWGVDYLKYDYCFCPDYVSANNDYKMAFNRYKAMGDALKATGRPILFSLCEWGPRSPWLWGKEAGGHMWRTTYDVAD
ncbi:MAG TPA: glycoside hydrolase family 27 protein, partial [Chitinophagaceae bacterium]